MTSPHSETTEDTTVPNRWVHVPPRHERWIFHAAEHLGWLPTLQRREGEAGQEEWEFSPASRGATGFNPKCPGCIEPPPWDLEMHDD